MKRAICIVLILALLSSVCFAVANAYSYPLVGSTESTVYHYSDCSYANNIKQENRITFIDAQDAVNRGYHPCTRCNPPQPGGTITPTVKPSATPSPTPTSKPTVTPTPSATAKPTENPTVTAKPTTTPTTTLTPSPTATSTQTSQPTPTPTSTANPTNLPSPTPISTPITIGTPDAISPIDPTPQPQIISQSPTPSVPELGIPSLLTLLMLVSILVLFCKRGQRKEL